VPSNVAKGVIGGLNAAPSGNWRRTHNGDREQLPSFHIATIKSGDAIEYRSCAGGGYGRPSDRDPQRVVKDVNRQLLTAERAEEVYKVALTLAPNGVDYEVDGARTKAIRAALV